MLRSLTNLHNFPSPPGGLGNWWHACKHEVEPSNTHASGGHGQSWGTWQACSSLVTELTTPSFSPRHAHCEGGCPEGAPGPHQSIGSWGNCPGKLFVCMILAETWHACLGSWSEAVYKLAGFLKPSWVPGGVMAAMMLLASMTQSLQGASARHKKS